MKFRRFFTPWLLIATMTGFGCVSSAPPRSDLLDVDGYTASGWTLMTEGQTDEAIELLQEGIQHNPDAFQLYVVLGQVYTRRGRASENPDDSFRLARESYEKAIELGMEERKRTVATTWSEYQGTDLRDAVRMSVLLEAKFGDPSKAAIIGRRYLQVVGPDPVIERNLPPASD